MFPSSTPPSDAEPPLGVEPPLDEPAGPPLAVEPPPDGPAGPDRRDARLRIGRSFGFVALAIVLVFAGSGLFLAGFALGTQWTNEPGTPADAEAAFQPFWNTYDAITQHYAGEPVTRQQLVDGAIKGMLEALGDPFSFYMSPDSFTAALQGTAGQIEGVGATITSRKSDGTEGCTPLAADCALIVVEPLAGGPADKAGIKAGDRIVAVDGVSVAGATVAATLTRVRGPKGTVVTLTVARGSAAPIQIAITRDVIVLPEVVAKDLAGGRVGYLSVVGFSDNSAAQFKQDLAVDVAAGKKAIILDLRGDPGGQLTAALKIASQFIASGPIYWLRPASGAPEATAAATGGVATDPSIKLVVLIDKNSASASEIVAAAFQDTKRGTLVGQQSYGKGTVQQFLPLDGNNGGFRLTIARWLSPNQRWINKVGLTPDVAVPLPDANTPAGTDAVLDRALQLLGVGAPA